MKHVPDKSSNAAVRRNIDTINKTVDPGAISILIGNNIMLKIDLLGSNVSLDNIRGHFHSTYKRHNDILAQQLRKKEQELIDDIKMRKERKAKESELR